VNLFLCENIEDTTSPLVGQLELSIDKFVDLQEFDVELEIPDVNNPAITNVVINSKAIFIYSQYEYYSQQAQLTQMRVNKLEERIAKSNELLNELERLSFVKCIAKDDQAQFARMLQHQQQNQSVTNAQTTNPNSRNVKSNKLLPSNNSQSHSHNISNSFACTVDNFISSKTNTTFNWNAVALYTALFILIFTLLMSTTKTDLINITCLVCICHRLLNYKLYDADKSFTFFSLLLSIALAYDVLWLFFGVGMSCDRSVWMDCSLKVAWYYLTIVLLIMKCVLWVEMFILKGKTEVQ
jgi:hypothetical protein